MEGVQGLGKQLVKPGASGLVHLFMRKPPREHLFNPKFAKRFTLGVEQNFLALLAAAAYQQYFHGKVFRQRLNFTLHIVQVVVGGDFDIEPDGGD